MLRSPLPCRRMLARSRIKETIPRWAAVKLWSAALTKVWLSPDFQKPPGGCSWTAGAEAASDVRGDLPFYLTFALLTTPTSDSLHFSAVLGSCVTHFLELCIHLLFPIFSRFGQSPIRGFFCQSNRQSCPPASGTCSQAFQSIINKTANSNQTAHL